MEKYIGQIVNFIRNADDFKYLNISSPYNNMGATIIDGILQSGLRYETVVKPRVDKFKKEFQEIKTTSQFYALINNNDLSEIIKMKGQKVDRIILLVKFLKNEKIETEDDFHIWLRNNDNLLLLSNLKGIKRKTIEYFKILTGHTDTVAIDVRLRKFISMCCDGFVISNNDLAHEILIRVSEKLGIEPATLDYSIWSYMSSNRLIKDKSIYK